MMRRARRRVSASGGEGDDTRRRARAPVTVATRPPELAPERIAHAPGAAADITERPAHTPFTTMTNPAITRGIVRAEGKPAADACLARFLNVRRRAFRTRSRHQTERCERDQCGLTGREGLGKTLSQEACQNQAKSSDSPQCTQPTTVANLGKIRTLHPQRRTAESHHVTHRLCGCVRRDRRPGGTRQDGGSQWTAMAHVGSWPYRYPDSPGPRWHRIATAAAGPTSERRDGPGTQCRHRGNSDCVASDGIAEGPA